MSDLVAIRRALERKKGKKQQIEKNIAKAEKQLAKVRRSLEANELAQPIIHEVAKITQKELQGHISDLVTYGLTGILVPPPTFELDLVTRRIREKDKQTDPMGSSGGGAVDITSLTLRLAMKTLQEQGTRPILILDEPLKWLKGADLPLKGAELIKQFSSQLKIQVIMASHDPELIDCADQVISVTHKKYSRVKIEDK